MTSWDHYIGFEREPIDLDEFLNSCGYDKTSKNNDTNKKDYGYRGRRLIDICYSFKPVDTEGKNFPDWKNAGIPIISELLITTKDPSAIGRASRLSKAIVRKYNAVLYDTNLNDFLRQGQL